MDQLSACTTLATMEREFGVATAAWLRARTWDDRATAWERRNDLARLIRGHCKTYHLVPAVDVGGLND